MSRFELAALFLLGGAAYVGLELAWRGTTHWTMFFAGGVALCWLRWLWGVPLPLPVLGAVGALGVTLLEFGAGVFCTRVLRLHVWDYSREWGNVAGLVCPKYTALWFILCLGVLYLFSVLQKAFPEA